MPYDRAALEEYLKQLMEGTINNGQMMPPDRTAANALRGLPNVQNPQDLGGPQNPGIQDFDANLQPDPNDPRPGDDPSAYNDAEPNPQDLETGGKLAGVTKPRRTIYVKGDDQSKDRVVMKGAANLPDERPDMEAPSDPEEQAEPGQAETDALPFQQAMKAQRTAPPPKKRGFDANFTGPAAALPPRAVNGGRAAAPAPPAQTFQGAQALGREAAQDVPMPHPDPQSLQDPEQDPPEAQVSNQNLAAANNLTGPGVEPQNVSQHAQDTIMGKPPEDQSAYLAALKEVQASAFRSVGQEAPKGGLYDTLLQKNLGDQHDYKAQVAASLKQKYASEQKDQDQAETRRYHDALIGAGTRRLDQGDKRLNRVNLKVDGIDERMYTKMAAAAGGKLPSAGEVQSLNDVLAQLDDGGPQGSGYFMNKDGWQSFLRSPKGAAFRQAVLSVINPHIKRQHGASVTEGEEERAMGQFGYGSFNSPEELDSGMRRVAMEQQKNIDQIVRSIPPEARAKLESWGGVPQVNSSMGSKPQAGARASESENFAPGQILPDKMKVGQGLKDWASGGDEANEAVEDWIKKRMTTQEAVDQAKSMEDEEERKRLRPAQ